MKWIKSIEIKNSIFFEDIKIDFSENMNCIMGGRGTGKSSIIHFLKTALSDQDIDKNIYNLLKANLGAGEIIVEFYSQNGDLYRISKLLNGEPQIYKLPSLEVVKPEQTYQLFECDFYETGKIEEIGRSGHERLMLIDKEIKDEIKENEKEIKVLQGKLNLNAQDIINYEQDIKMLKESLLDYEGAELDFESHKSSPPPNIHPEENQEYEIADNKQNTRATENKYLMKARNQLDSFVNDLNIFSRKLLDIKTNNNEFATERQEILSFITEYNMFLESNISDFTSKTNLISNQIQKLDALQLKIKDVHSIEENELLLLKQKFDSNRAYFTRYNQLSKRIQDKLSLVESINEIRKKVELVLQQRDILKNEFNQCRKNVYSIRLKYINKLNKIFNGNIIIKLKYAGITDEYENLLREILKGSGLKYNELIYKIIDNYYPDEFGVAILKNDINNLKSKIGYDDARLQTLVHSVLSSNLYYQLDSIYCKDLPTFLLKINNNKEDFENSYKESEYLSMGQRCTVVLPIIFAISENPLLIDQPEDNLDNKFISTQIHNIIKDQKRVRQLIFVTHNPNIPVLSNSEKNFFLSYENKSTLSNQGNVDDVKDEIIKILEGGEKAFVERRDKYGLGQ